MLITFFKIKILQMMMMIKMICYLFKLHVFRDTKLIKYTIYLMGNKLAKLKMMEVYNLNYLFIILFFKKIIKIDYYNNDDDDYYDD